MRFRSILAYVLFSSLTSFPSSLASSPSQVPLLPLDNDANPELPPLRNITATLFASLEEHARLVDIAYCVGTTGIQKPFLCASRCEEFPDLELITTWSTGVLLSDSCGYLAVSHLRKHIILAFRGTYSLTNTIVDLSTVPQEYEPYPPDGGDDYSTDEAAFGEAPEILGSEKCPKCTVHTGFLLSWRNTRPEVLPHLIPLLTLHPDYSLQLVGHSLGGAVAALAGLELHRRGFRPQVTTFGEPMIGNDALSKYIDERFALGDARSDVTDKDRGGNERTALPPQRFRRVTHINDPVPLLPLEEWGYRPHAGEIFIGKPELPPSVADIRHCAGDGDPRCVSGDTGKAFLSATDAAAISELAIAVKRTAGVEEGGQSAIDVGHLGLTLPTRFRLWQLFHAHRDYFWRLGLCVPGGDPADWWRGKEGMEGEHGHV